MDSTKDFEYVKSNAWNKSCESSGGTLSLLYIKSFLLTL